MLKTKAILLSVLASVVALAALVSAQGRDDKLDAPAGVEVISFDWKYDGYVPFETVQQKNTSLSTTAKRQTSYVFKYAARLTVKNAGEKSIKVVDWDYVFVEPDGGRELKRYAILSKREIAPGATVQLTKEISIPPDESTRHINTGKQKVQVTRVEFADGTVWRREDAKTQDRKPQT